jgi:L-histidine N-alpha-methyltransferase
MLLFLHKLITISKLFSSRLQRFFTVHFKTTPKLSSIQIKALQDLQGVLNGTKRGNLTHYMYWGKNDYFDQLITKHKEYYLYNDEISTINSNIDKIQKCFKTCDTIIDLGPGSNSSFIKKTLPLLKAVKNLSQYYGVDISKDYATNAARLAKKHIPLLDTLPIIADINDLELPDSFASSKTRLFLFTGSTLGNFSNTQIDIFLKKVSSHMHLGDHLLITCDMNHDKDSLLKAYDNKYAKLLVLNSLKHIAKLVNAKINFKHIKIICKWEPKNKIVRQYFISSKEQNLNNDFYNLKISSNKKYNIVNSRKFDNIAIQKQFNKHDLQVLESFMSHNNRMAIYVFRKNMASGK